MSPLSFCGSPVLLSFSVFDINIFAVLPDLLMIRLPPKMWLLRHRLPFVVCSVNTAKPPSLLIVSLVGLFSLSDFATLMYASTSFIWLTPLFVVCGVLLLLPYQKACRGLIRLDVCTKTSIYSRVMEITTGLRHIRALQSQEDYLGNVFQQLHAWQKVSYHQFAAERWFNLGLELIVFAAAMFIATLAVYSASTNSSPASIALAIFVLMRLNWNLGRFIKACNASSTHMSAMSASQTTIHCTSGELHLDTMTQSLSDVWPPQGNVLLQNLSAGYG